MFTVLSLVERQEQTHMYKAKTCLFLPYYFEFIQPTLCIWKSECNSTVGAPNKPTTYDFWGHVKDKEYKCGKKGCGTESIILCIDGTFVVVGSLDKLLSYSQFLWNKHINRDFSYTTMATSANLFFKIFCSKKVFYQQIFEQK